MSFRDSAIEFCFEPFFVSFVFRHYGGHDCVECRGVVHFLSVRKFVNYNIIKNIFRGKNEAPVEV